MSGPWEDYAEGPWTDYAKPKPTQAANEAAARGDRSKPYGTRENPYVARDRDTLYRMSKNPQLKGKYAIGPSGAVVVIGGDGDGRGVVAELPKKAPRKPKVGTVDDVVQSAGSGVVQGVTGFLGMGGDLRNLGDAASRFGKERGVNIGLDDWLVDNVPGLKWAADNLGGPTSAQVDEQVQKVTGEYHEPQTQAGRYARAGGRMLPNAATGGGGAAARTAQVAVPAVTGESSRWLVEALGGDERAQALAEFVGTLGGGVLSSVRPQKAPRVPKPDGAKGARRATRTTTPAEMRQRADQYRAAGLEPRLTDVTDEAGRGVIREAASRQTPAREQVQRSLERLTANAPRKTADRVADLTPDARAADVIQAELKAARQAQASQNYAAAAPDRVSVPPVAGAIQQQDDVLARAAKTLRDNRQYDLADQVEMMRQGAAREVNVGALDQVKREMFTAADNAVSAPGARSNSAPGLTSRAQEIDDYLASQSSAYRGARDAYAQASGRIDGVDVGRKLPDMSYEQASATMRQMTPEQIEGARIGARQRLQDVFTGSTQADTGLRKLEMEDDLKRIIADLFDPQTAEGLSTYAEMSRRQLNNARYIAPNTGSQTAPRLQDGASVAAGALDDMQSLRQSGVVTFVISKVGDALRRASFPDAEAEKLARLAIDPSKTDDVIRYLEARQPGLGAQVMSLIQESQKALASPATGGAAALSLPGIARDRRDQEPPRR